MSADVMYRFLHFVRRFLQFFTAINLPESETISLTKLPYGFRQRIARQSFTAKIQHNFIRTCSVIDRREPYWDDHDQVFITDNHVVCKRAMKDTFLFRICKCLDQFKYWRKTKDGPYTIYPVWKSVLLIDEILDKKKEIFIHETLILHCQIDGNEKVIPSIHGHYTRLVVHGRIRLDQLKRLIHPGVKQVRVGGRIEIDPLDYDDFVEFVIRHCRNVDYTSFSFGSLGNDSHEIRARLNNACRNHETHDVYYHDTKHHVAHRLSENDRLYFFFVLFVFLTLITIVIPIALVFVPGGVMNKPNEVLERENKFYLVFFISIPFLIIIFLFIILGGLPFDTMDIISDISDPANSIQPA